MIYAVCYLLLGMLFVILKSPIRKLVDEEIRNWDIHYIATGEEPPTTKLFLLRIILSLVLIVIYPIMLFVDVKEKIKKRKKKDAVVPKKLNSDISYLTNRLTVKEAEEKNMVEIDGRQVPFGYTNDQWVVLCKQMQKKDELYEFRSPEDSWNSFAGREGIALVRDGEIIADIITLMS